MSFTLYYGGKDIFVDSGHFGYGNTKERRYLISEKAHNTFLIEEGYTLVDKEESFNKIKITDFISNSHYSLVRGQNISYKDTNLYRTIILFKPDIIFVYDKGISNSEQEYTQLFNLAPKVNVTKLDDNIEIIQINNKFISTCHKANREEPIGVISEKAEQLTNTSQVSFKKKSQNINILTMISLDNSKEKVKTLKDKLKNEIVNTRNIKRIKIAVAYFSEYGLKTLQNLISNNNLSKNRVEIYLSPEFTNKNQGQILKELNKIAKTYVVFDAKFHPKVYLFECENSNKLIFGSSNFTQNGIESNIEFDSILEITNTKAEKIKVDLFFDHCKNKAKEVDAEMIE